MYKNLYTFFLIISLSIINTVFAKWEEPIAISGINASANQLAVDSKGNAVAVWNNNDNNEFKIEASILTLDGIWLPSIDISASNVQASAPQIACDMDGQAVAIWTQEASTSESPNPIYEVFASNLKFGTTTWSTPVKVSKSDSSTPSIKYDSNGNAIALWIADNKVQGSKCLKDSSTWSVPVDISTTDLICFSPNLAVDSLGNVIAYWIASQSPTSNTYIQSSTLDASTKTWSSPITITNSMMCAMDPFMIIDNLNNKYLIWASMNEEGFSIQFSSLPTHAKEWSIPIALTTGISLSTPSLGVDKKGNLIAVWQAVDENGNMLVQTSRCSFKGSWDPPVNLSNKMNLAMFPQITMDANGCAFAYWTELNINSIGHIVATKTTPESVWSELTTLSNLNDICDNPNLIIDSSERVIALWTNESTTKIEATSWNKNE